MRTSDEMLRETSAVARAIRADAVRTAMAAERLGVEAATTREAAAALREAARRLCGLCTAPGADPPRS